MYADVFCFSVAYAYLRAVFSVTLPAVWTDFQNSVTVIGDTAVNLYNKMIIKNLARPH